MDGVRVVRPGEPRAQARDRATAFGMNKHLAAPDVRRVVSEITGRPCGAVRRWGDGRQDARAVVEPVAWGPGDVERVLPLNDLRRLLYERARQAGQSHEEAVGRLFPNGRVKA